MGLLSRLEVKGRGGGKLFSGEMGFIIKEEVGIRRGVRIVYIKMFISGFGMFRMYI